jgi:hypothetical protein
MTRVDDLRRLGAVVALGAVSLTACSGGTPDAAAQEGALPQGGEPVQLDPADFTVDVTHPYWPMRPGDRWVYEETGEGRTRRVEVTVTDRTTTVAAGIEARVVHDLVTEGGTPVEDTLDLYAQDADGNLWYLGERTAEYEDGRVVSTEGSWEAGVDGAQPGIALPAQPRPGTGYRQEYRAGRAEDQGFVLATDERVQVPTGTYPGALLTRDTTPLEPDVEELKLYAPGIGPVLTLQVSGGTEREELVETTRTG